MGRLFTFLRSREETPPAASGGQHIMDYSDGTAELDRRLTAARRLQELRAWSGIYYISIYLFTYPATYFLTCSFSLYNGCEARRCGDASLFFSGRLRYIAMHWAAVLMFYLYESDIFFYSYSYVRCLLDVLACDP